MTVFKAKEKKASIVKRPQLAIFPSSIAVVTKSSKPKFWTSIFLKKTTFVRLEKLKVRRKCRSYNELLLKMMKDLEAK